jgi:hypothetical protein
MTSIEQIEMGVNKLLQSNIIFALENKIVKKGKLILFCVKDFFCVFTLICEEKNNKKIIYEIPYPFALNALNNKVIFDYTVNTFCEKNKQVVDIIRTLGIEKTSKLFNKRLSITAV